jgi:hypothetical protein
MKRPLHWVLGMFIMASCNDKPQITPDRNMVLNVYPNPASDQASIYVRTRTNQPFHLQVFDTRGNIILEQQAGGGEQHYSLPLRGMPKGNYQVTLRVNDSLSRQKLIKL